MSTCLDCGAPVTRKPGAGAPPLRCPEHRRTRHRLRSAISLARRDGRYATQAREQETELGTERLCYRCGEWWPRDSEFYYFDRYGHIAGPCRACWSERNAAYHAERKRLAAA